MSLELDEEQEFRNGMRKMASMGQLMWDALTPLEIPDRVREEMFLRWWTVMMTPRIEMPDFSKLFKTDD